jgi:histidinol dehydrogenase
MLPVVDLRGSDRDPAELLPRAPAAKVEAARAGVRELVAAVAARGDAAVAEAARRFDGVEAPPAAWRATAGELAAAEDALGPELRAALADAIERVHAFHLAQRPTDRSGPAVPGSAWRSGSCRCAARACTPRAAWPPIPPAWS